MKYYCSISFIYKGIYKGLYIWVLKRRSHGSRVSGSGSLSRKWECRLEVMQFFLTEIYLCWLGIDQNDFWLYFILGYFCFFILSLITEMRNFLQFKMN
jgi:hypothetical protein